MPSIPEAELRQPPPRLPHQDRYRIAETGAERLALSQHAAKIDGLKHDPGALSPARVLTGTGPMALHSSFMATTEDASATTEDPQKQGTLTEQLRDYFTRDLKAQEVGGRPSLTILTQ